jgi:hypothetical protein
MDTEVQLQSVFEPRGEIIQNVFTLWVCCMGMLQLIGEEGDGDEITTGQNYTPKHIGFAMIVGTLSRHSVVNLRTLHAICVAL